MMSKRILFIAIFGVISLGSETDPLPCEDGYTEI